MRRLQLTYILLAGCLFLAGCSPNDPWQRGTVEAYVPIYSTDPDLKSVRYMPARKIVESGKLYHAGTNALLEEKDSGLHVISYADPIHPQRTGFIRIPGIREVTVNGNYLYADNYNDFVIIDMTTFKVAGRITGVWAQKSYPPLQDVYFQCADTSKGTIIGWRKTMVDNPQCRTTYTHGYPLLQGSFHTNPGLVVAQHHLYLVNEEEGSIHVYDVQQPSLPVMKKTWSYGAVPDSIFLLDQDLAVMADDYPWGMELYDLTLPEAPVLKETYPDFSPCMRIIGKGQYVYALSKPFNRCSLSSGLGVYDLNKDSASLLVSFTTFENDAHSFAVFGNIIYVSHASTLDIVDVAGPSDPVIVQTMSAGSYSDMLIDGQQLIARGNQGTHFYDISVPQRPVLLSKLAD